MAEIMGPATEEQPGERLTWSKVWISAITRPSTETFDWILRAGKPKASLPVGIYHCTNQRDHGGLILHAWI